MSTSRNPLYLNTSGRTQLFSGEDTLSWNFTSATGNPMELLVSSSTYFTFERDGSFTLEKDVTWNADSGGSVGDQYDLRPANVNAATKVAVGAVSGTGDGAKLELNTLTLGHTNVDKYIDAEQGLANTPALRYNAVNTRWEFSDDGISFTSFNAGFGTTDWDTLYAADKTLLINSTVLTFTQTSSTGIGFALTRNLASASTDSPAVLIEQQNAGDDQPGLAIAQVATSASALDIYEGTQAAGTVRYGFGATGKLTLTTNSALADSALHLLQNDVDDSFITFEGTSGAGASVNISTDNGATADMIQVVVDGGAAATRWIPAYASTTLPGVPTWDSVYASDKHLDINAAVLQFEQTSTTGRAFEIFRNLASASTDAPVVVLEQQNAGDDQPPLAIGQLASAADVLRLYDGSVASGTMRFQFEPQGRLNIVTNASLGSEALRIEQNDDNVAFVEFKGTAAAGATKNISTDNNPTADMLRVDVDDGGGAATRWIPAYASSTLPATATWDAIYAGDKTLDISSTVLTFNQSSTTGIGFTVSRNLAAASTDSPIMLIDQTSSLDDQPALKVTGGIGDVAGGVAVLEALATSAGMATIGEIQSAIKATVATHASDTVATFNRAYEAVVNTAGGGLATNIGFWAGSGFDSGVYSDSPITAANTAEVINPAGASVALTVTQDGSGLLQEWIGTSAATRMTLSEVGAVAHTPANPTGAFTGHTQTLTSGGLGAVTATGHKISVVGAAGDVGSSLYGLDIDYTDNGGGYAASGRRAINIGSGWDYGLYTSSSSYFNSAVLVNSTLTMLDNQSLWFGNLPDARFLYSTIQTADTLVLGLSADSNNLLICEVADLATDFSHALQSNPTIFIQSADATNIGEFVGMSYLGMQADTMTTDKAAFDVSVVGCDAYGSAVTNIDGGHVVLTPGAAVGAGVEGLVRTTASLYVTDNVGAPTVPTTFRFPFMIDSDPSASFPSAGIYNAGSNASILLYLAQGDIENAVGATARFSVNVDGQTGVNVDNSSEALTVSQNSSSGTSRLLRLTDVNGSSNRFDVNQDGQVLVEADVADSGVKICQDNGTTTVVLECAEGTQSSHNARFQVQKNGAVLITPANPTSGFTSLDTTFTSGGLASLAAYGFVANITTNAGDTGTTQYYGLDLNLTDSGGVSNTVAIDGTSDWDEAFRFDTDPAASEYSATVCNAGSNSSYLLYLGEGTVDQIGGTNSNRLVVSVNGETNITANNSSYGVQIRNNGSGDTLRLLDSSSATLFSQTQAGKAKFLSSATVASEIVELEQQDADQPFFYFNGTASDPAAGSAPADNITEINGSGAVVGPQTTSGSPDTGWAFNGMVKMKVDSVGGGTKDVWIATYSAVTS